MKDRKMCERAAYVLAADFLSCVLDAQGGFITYVDSIFDDGRRGRLSFEWLPSKALDDEPEAEV